MPGYTFPWPCLGEHRESCFGCTAQTQYHAAQHRAQQVRVLKHAPGAQAMKADRDKLDNIVQNIRAELESVELDPKATKQLKERIKSLLEKTAKLKLKVRRSLVFSNISQVCLPNCASISPVLMLDMQMCSRAPQLDCWSALWRGVAKGTEGHSPASTR